MAVVITNLRSTSVLSGASLIWSDFETSSSVSGTQILVVDNDGSLDGGTFANWLSTAPNTTDAAEYEIRWTASGGTLTKTTSLTQNTWYPLSTGRTFSIDGTQGAADKVGSFTIEIRKISTGGTGTTAVWTHRIVGTG